MKLNMEIEIQIPTVPNFIAVKGKTVLRQEGFKAESNSIPVQDFSDEDLIKIAEDWKNTLLANARAKRRDRNETP